MTSGRGICGHCAKLDMRDIRVAGRPQVSYTCGLNFHAPNVERYQLYERLICADDDVPPRVAAFWRRPMKIVTTVI